MSLEEVKDAADFSERSRDPKGGAPRLSLLGGEPTSHSNFVEIVDYLLARKFAVTLFSNGTFSRERADYLAALPAERVDVVLNVNRPEAYSKAEWDRVNGNLMRLRGRVLLGLTVDRVDFDYETPLGLIRRHGLKRDVRLGISLPIVKASNAFLPFPEYRLAGGRIVRFAAAAAEAGVRLGFDCGFILCMFTRRELGRLQLCNVRLSFTCDGAVDIGKGGRAWRCFPLHGVHDADYRRFASVAALREHYNRVLPAKTKGISGACGRCRHYRRGHCSGGCYSHELR